MAGSQEPPWKEALRRDSVGEKVAQVALNSGKGGSSGLILSSRGWCLPGKGALGAHVRVTREFRLFPVPATPTLDLVSDRK